MNYIVTNEPAKIELMQPEGPGSILQNVRTIISTFKGEVPINRDFGLSRDWLDKPVNVARPLIIADVHDAVETYEPRAEVIDVVVSNPSPGQLFISVEVSISEES